MSHDLDDANYTSEYADSITLKPESNLMCRMLFFEKRAIIDNNGKVINIKKEIKFEVRVPIETIGGLQSSIFKMMHLGSTVQELPKKPMPQDIVSLQKTSDKFFSVNYDTDEVPPDDIADARFKYIKNALGSWCNVK